MSEDQVIYDFDEEFDPLWVSDEDINQEEMDDTNPYDTVDFPTIRNAPEALLAKESLYTPETQGSPRKALLALIDYNPARRPVLLEILDSCREGCPSSVIEERVAEKQQFNRSVYSAMTFCRMLERAGGLVLEVPEVSEEKEVVEEGVAYLEIKETIDPLWYTTPDGLEVFEELTNGDSFRSIVFDRDAKYYDVYFAVLESIKQQARSRVEIDELVDTFDICREPRRFGSHFIDMLEKTDGIVWLNDSWNITELGISMLEEMREAEASGTRVHFSTPAQED